MPSDYERIREENIKKYGTDIHEYGPDLLANLYSDRTHFVYELVQNAEDAGAEWMKFDLFQDRLEVRHNGRPFDEDDVLGICRLAKGTKTNDLTKIGKFGIGFKSVYAYTNTPKVYSVDEAFGIKNYVHPYPIRPVSIGKETLFVFPFNHKDVSEDTAFKEIAKRLHDLGSQTLLFLRHIEWISWKIEGEGERVFFRKTTKSAGEINIRVVDVSYRVKALEAKTWEAKRWLIFDHLIENHSGNDELRVEAAFRIGVDSKAKKKRIDPIPSSSLVAFFPTDKETHLRFLIQGPYRTTPARDNIPNYNEWNIKLIRETATLVADTIPKIKEMGLLTTDFLTTLPISPKDFPKDYMFRPIYDAVLEKLKSDEKLLPANNSGYISSRRAFLSRGRGLIDLLGVEQLALLFGKQDAKWLDANITQDRTPELRNYVMSELGIPEIDAERFANQLDEEFIEAQDDEWVIRFYGFLSGQRALWRKPERHSGKRTDGGPLSSKRIIRLSDNTHVQPYTENGEPNAHLPGDFESSFPTVKWSIVEDEDAKRFLQSLGFTTFDIYAEVVKQVLPKYKVDKVAVGYEEGLADNKKIAQALKKASKSKRDELILKIKEIPILVGEKKGDKKRHPCCPRDGVYLSSNSQLEEFFETIGVINNIVFLDDRYSDIYDIDTLKEVGCIGELDRRREVEERVLPKYRESEIEISNRVSADANVRDVEVIIQTIESLDRWGECDAFTRELEKHRFLRTMTAATKGKAWCKPQETYLTELYTGKDDLETYFEGNPNVYFLTEAYKGFTISQLSKLLGCLLAIKVEYKADKWGDGYVTILDQHSWHRRGLDGFDPNFRIEGLEYALAHINAAKARVIWDTLKRYSRTICGVVEMSGNKNYPSDSTTTEKQVSRTGKLVREKQWLPDKNGSFRAPSELRLSDLPDDFDKESSAAKELAVHLGCRPETDLSQLSQFFSEEKIKKFAFAETLRDDEIEMIEARRRKELAAAHERDDDGAKEGLSYQEEFEHAFNRPQMRENEGSDHIPPGHVPDPEHRRKRTQQDIRDTIDSEPPLLQRFQRVPAKKWERKNNETRNDLKEQYQGQCQICGHTFIQRNGEPYFEGLYLVSRTGAAWVDRSGNVLCLCANCCAKMLHGQVEARDIIEQITSFRGFDEGGKREAIIRFRLCGEDVHLGFSERHILDLQEMLKVDRELSSRRIC